MEIDLSMFHPRRRRTRSPSDMREFTAAVFGREPEPEPEEALAEDSPPPVDPMRSLARRIFGHQGD